MVDQILTAFTQATAKPEPFSLVFMLDPDLAAPRSRAFAFHFVMESVQDFIAVEDATISDPTTLTPVRDQKWIIGTTATGAWATHDEELALWDGGAWLFATPSEGWRFYSKTQDQLYLYDGANWIVDLIIPPIVAADKGKRLRVNSAGTNVELVAGPKAGTDSIAGAASEKAIAFTTAFATANYTPVVIGVAGLSLFRIKTGTIATTGFTVERLDTNLQALETTGAETFSWAAIPHEDL